MKLIDLMRKIDLDFNITIIDINEKEIAYGNSFQIRNNLVAEPEFNVYEYEVNFIRVGNFPLELQIEVNKNI